ncbi:hypothetical protein GCM10020000_51340 [Streptomyces olivoverticillatus]
MSTRLYDPHPAPHTHTAACVTPAGADWLASASRFPRSVQALWSDNPTACLVLPCGSAFDVISAPPRCSAAGCWTACGPRAPAPARSPPSAAGCWSSPPPGTAQRLPALLGWEEWAGRGEDLPPLLCHGVGDAVTVPALCPPGESEPSPPPHPLAGRPGGPPPLAPRPGRAAVGLRTRLPNWKGRFRPEWGPCPGPCARPTPAHARLKHADFLSTGSGC